ncbi:maleylpyruvate isomerase N-terminal domain-containing protein [Actinoplanes sp. NPDC049265]|uniref:maleylpyruvate isomerase N-terminal domain-containing protein n=1 Tax=Actinoplanes sp. NPDC049265 TaxID=3363902 RepID=UPI00370FBB43
MNFRHAYRAAAVSFADLITRVPADRWDAAALGEWSLRDLVGHVTTELRDVPEVLATPADAVEVPSTEAYWAFARVTPVDVVAKAHAESGRAAREAGQALGDDPASVVNQLIGRATQALAGTKDNDVVSTAAGGMRVRDWLPTRTFELVVHGQDVADAAGRDFAPGLDAMAEAVTQATFVAVAVGDGPLLLRALTGRTALPDRYSVIS